MNTSVVLDIMHNYFVSRIWEICTR